MVTLLYVLPDWVGCSNLHQFGWFNLCLDQFSQGIFHLVTKFFDCVCGTYYNQNNSCGTRSRLGDLHRIGWFNLYLYRFSLNLVTKIFDCVCGTDYNQCLDRFSQGIFNLVMKIFDCVCGIYYNQNHSCGTKSRLGDLLQIGWFNLHLDWLVQWILTLHTEFSYLVCGLQYCCFFVSNPKYGFAEM